MGTVESVIKKYVHSKYDLLWLELRNIQGAPADCIDPQIPSGIAHEILSIEEHPEWNIEIQYLFERLNLSDVSMPFHVFVETKKGKVVFASPALEKASLEKILNDLLAWLWVDEAHARSDFSNTCVELYSTDPARVITEPARVFGLRDAILNPLLQSFDSKTGCFGSEGRLSLFPAAYRAMGFVDSEGASLKELALVQSLKSPLWDQLSGLYYRFYDSQSSRVCAEKWLLPNLEMLVEIADEHQKYGNPFLKESFVEGFHAVVREFVAEDGSLIAGLYLGDENSQSFDSKDLLNALNTTKRHLAQEFYGFGPAKTLPRIREALKELCARLSLELADTRLKLAEIKKDLLEFRIKRNSGNLRIMKANAEQHFRAYVLLKQLTPWVENIFHSSQFSSYIEFLNHIKLRSKEGSIKLPLELKNYQGRSVFQESNRFLGLDSEYCESSLAFDLRQLSRAEKMRFFESQGPLLENYKSLGLKGMGWMSYFLEHSAFSDRYTSLAIETPSVT